MKQKNLPGIKRPVGRPQKYHSEEERKKARRKAQKKYCKRQLEEGRSLPNGSRVGTKAFTLMLSCGEFLYMMKRIKSKNISQGDFISQLIIITSEYEADIRNPARFKAPISKKRSEKKLIEGLNTLLNLNK